MKFELSETSFSVLREAVEDICSWCRGHEFELYFHVPGTSPKEYKLLSNSVDVDNFVRQSCQYSESEIVVITPEVHVEDCLNVRNPASCADDIQLSATLDLPFDNKFLVGSHFSDAKDFKNALRTDSIINNYGVKITLSDRTRVLAACTSNDCPWRVRAALCSDGQTFEIKNLGGAHSCPGINRAGNKQATIKWIAGEIKKLIGQ